LFLFEFIDQFAMDEFLAQTLQKGTTEFLVVYYLNI